MPNLKATLWEKYHYNVTVKDNPSLRDVALAISLEVHRQEKKTKFTKTPRTFNYILKCLEKHADFNFRLNINGESKDRIKEALESASYLNSTSKPQLIECPECGGKGHLEAEDQTEYESTWTCTKCRGYGKLVSRTTYRIGNTFSNRLVIDIDSKDPKNIKDVKEFYEKLLGEKFRIFHTTAGKGVWLFGSQELKTVEDFVYAHCCVLQPRLERKDMKDYVNALMALDKNKKDEFSRATPEIIKASGLYSGHGNFDVAFTFLSIKRKRSTIRRSAKRLGDEIKEMII